MEIIRTKIVSVKKVDLKRLRKKAGLTLRQLEKLSGVSFVKLHHHENDLKMDEEVWKKIANIFDKIK